MSTVIYGSFHRIAKVEKFKGTWDATTGIQGYPLTASKVGTTIVIHNRAGKEVYDEQFDAIYREVSNLYANLSGDVVIHMIVASENKLESSFVKPNEMENPKAFIFHADGVDVNFIFDLINSDSTFDMLKSVEYQKVGTMDEIEDMYWNMANQHQCGVLLRETTVEGEKVFYSRPLDKVAKLKIVALEDSKRMEKACSGAIVTGLVGNVNIRYVARLGISVALGREMYEKPDNFIGKTVYIHYKKVHNNSLVAGRYCGIVDAPKK